MAEDTETYVRDNNSYEITVDREQGGYFGRWFCRKCGVGGGSSVKDNSVETAILGAKTNLGPHHFMKHGSGKT